MVCITMHNRDSDKEDAVMEREDEEDEDSDDTDGANLIDDLAYLLRPVD